MIPLISRALLSWRQLCAMYLAHVRSFKAELMLFVPFLQILARLLAEASGKDSIKESSPLNFSDRPALRRWWLDITV